jgi:hypothetical protein
MGVDVANKAFDLLAIRGLVNRSLSDPGTEHIAWVDGSAGVSARLFESCPGTCENPTNAA